MWYIGNVRIVEKSTTPSLNESDLICLPNKSFQPLNGINGNS